MHANQGQNTRLILWSFEASSAPKLIATRVTAGQEDVPGILMSFGDTMFIVAMEKDLRPKIDASRLVAKDAFLVERLKERLEKVL